MHNVHCTYSKIFLDIYQLDRNQDDHPPPNADLHPRPRLLPFSLLLLACHRATELPRCASQACRFPFKYPKPWDLLPKIFLYKNVC